MIVAGYSPGTFLSSFLDRTKDPFAEMGAKAKKKNFSANPKKGAPLIGSKCWFHREFKGTVLSPVRLREVEVFQGKFKAEEPPSIRSRCSVQCGN